MALYTIIDAKEELKTEIESYGATIKQLDDRLNEYVDTALPIYYSDIMEEWRTMPAEYDGRGVDEFGLPAEPTVYNLMTGDLFAYYHDLYSNALEELRTELESEVA